MASTPNVRPLAARTDVGPGDLDTAWSAEVLRAATEAAGLAMWQLDLRTWRLRGSPALHRLLGQDEEPPVWSLEAFEKHLAADDVSLLRNAIARAQGGERLCCEVRVQRSDGGMGRMAILGQVVGGRSGAANCLAGVLKDITAPKTSELLGCQMQAVEEERGRISRELHDTLGQHLAVLAIQLKSVEEMGSDSMGQRLAQVRAVVRRIEDELDRLSYELRPLALDDLGLDEALRTYARNWASEAGVAVEVHTHGLRTARLLPGVETAVYRVVQESLTNVRKHASASRVGLIAERRCDELRVIVEDDGCGFDATAVVAEGGRRLGLRGMSERAQLVAGKLEVESVPGRGTTVYLSIPLARRRTQRRPTTCRSG